jgi:hypothetical protein
MQAFGLYVIIDEAHVNTVDQFMVLQTFEGDSKMIISSATLEGPMVEHLSDVQTFMQPDRIRPWDRHPTQVVDVTDDMDERQKMTHALNYVTAQGHDIKDGLFYHPSVRTLNIWATGAINFGCPIRYLTADIYQEGINAATFCTGVVLQGANIRPAPKFLLYFPVKLDMVHILAKDRDKDDIIRVPMGEYHSYLSLQQAPLSSAEMIQLEGRVGREKEGHCYIIGTVQPGELHASIVIAELYLLTYDNIMGLLRQTVLPASLDLNFSRNKFLGIYTQSTAAHMTTIQIEEGALFITLFLLLGSWNAVLNEYGQYYPGSSRSDALDSAYFHLAQWGYSNVPPIDMMRGLNAFKASFVFPYERRLLRGIIPVYGGGRIVLYQF